MPALTIPVCGFSVGSGPEIDDGIERVVSLGGTQRGISNYDAIKRNFTLVFEMCTQGASSETETIVAQYESNRLTGGMTFTAPWNAVAYTCDYIDVPQVTPGPVYSKVVLRLRQQ